MSDSELEKFLSNKSAHTLDLFSSFIDAMREQGAISVEPAKTMIGISNGRKKIAWITQLGKDFLHVVLPFKQEYSDNLCFQKIARVPGTNQFNHHLRLFFKDDLNEEVIKFLSLAYNEEC